MYPKHRLRFGLGLFAMLMLALGTSGCGYKGPLTLPPKTAALHPIEQPSAIAVQPVKLLVSWSSTHSYS